MCHGKAKLVSIDCEADGESGGALAALSVESDAVAMPLVHWTTRLAPLAPTPQVVEPQASLAGTASILSQPYILNPKRAPQSPPSSLYFRAGPRSFLPPFSPASRPQPHLRPSPFNPDPWLLTVLVSAHVVNMLTGALARLSHSYCAVVRGPGLLPYPSSQCPSLPRRLRVPPTQTQHSVPKDHRTPRDECKCK